MRVLITGNNGFIGEPLLNKLIQDTSVELIVAVDRAVTQASDPRVIYIKKDLETADTQWWESVITDNNIDTVYYLESIENVNIYNPDQLTTNNFQLSDFHFIDFLQKRVTIGNADLKVIYISTDKIYYGDTFPNEIHSITLESVAKENRRYFYSYIAQKALTEVNLQQVSGVDLRIIRPFSLTGPGRDPECPINRTIALSATNQDILLFNEGQQGVAFTHITDLVSLLTHENLFDVEIKKTLSSSIINFCRVQNYLSVKQLQEKIVNKMESPSKIIDSDTTDNIFSEVQDTPQIRNMVRVYQPTIPIEIILDEMIYISNPVLTYAPLVVTEVTPGAVNIILKGTAEPVSAMSIYFGNGEGVNTDVQADGNWYVDYTFEFPVDIYPIEIHVTTKDYIQYASVVITA